jgi:hypothetical protein
VSASQLNGDVAQKFFGAWRYVMTTFDGRPRDDRGGEPDGIIIYDSSGHMAVQIVPSRDQRASAPIDKFLAYFGRWTVDEGARTVTHHRAGDIRPDAPREVVREYRFEGDRLILRPAGSAQDIVWQRI